MTGLPPDLQPTLIGPSVLIRPLRADDWQGLYAVASDPLIWELHPAHTRWQEPVFRAFFEEALSWQSSFAFVDRATGAIIGSSRYHGYSPDTGEIEIGWTFLARCHWGGATNTEVKSLMLDHAFYLRRMCHLSSRRDKLALARCDAQDRRGAAGG